LFYQSDFYVIAFLPVVVIIIIIVVVVV